MRTKILCIISKLLGNVLYVIGKQKPIFPNLIVLESERDFYDNAWAFYQYMLENKKGYKYVWLTHSNRIYNSEKNTSFLSYESPKAKYILARAKYIFYTHSMFNLKFRTDQLCVYLGHGVALKLAKGDYAQIGCDFVGHPYKYAMTTGKFGVETQDCFLLCHRDEILPLGYPRNDILIRNKAVGKENQLINGNKYEKVVLWMPTFRKSINASLSEMGCDSETGLPLFSTHEEIMELNEILKKYNFIIICKLHHLQAQKEIFGKNFSNILFVTDDNLLAKGLQLYQMVAKTDALITDYSSICIDYLLLDKPMVFILDDIEQYRKSRGFVIDDIESIMPGYHVYNKNQLYAFLEDFNENKDPYKSERNNILPYIHEHVDEGNSERIVNYFKL